MKFRFNKLRTIAVFGAAMVLVSCGSEVQESEVNGSVSEIITSVVTLFDSETDLKPVIIGSTVPKDTPATHLGNGVEKTKTFTKKLEDILGIDLIDLKYSLSFDYVVQVDGKGVHIDNITYTPLDLDITGLIDLSATALVKYKNTGTKEHPIMTATVPITYRLKGLTETWVKTDEFSIHGFTGFVKAKIRPFEPDEKEQDITF